MKLMKKTQTRSCSIILLALVGCLNQSASEYAKSFENSTMMMTNDTESSYLVSSIPPSTSLQQESASPSNVPSNSNMPSNAFSTMPSNALSTMPTNVLSSIPSLWPQNTCYFTEDSSEIDRCKDTLTSNHADDDRIVPMGSFLCSPNKQYRFGITNDKFLCVCDGIEKKWCATDIDRSTFNYAQEPYLELRTDGCLAIYSDRYIRDKKIWHTKKNQPSNKNKKVSGKRPGPFRGIRDREEIVTQLKITDDGELSIFDVSDSSLLWKPILSNYKAYAPPTPSPTISILPSANPTISVAPSTSPSQKPSKHPTISPIPSLMPSDLPSSNPIQVSTYYPGKLIPRPLLGMTLSEGLSARIIGETGNRVRYFNGQFSNLEVHDQPDAGGCFDQPDGSWIYVSNSETKDFTGGVGAFSFRPNGNLQKYEMILSGTKMNCGGGITPWGTWLSGEEYPKGHMWEVDINGGGARKTQFGMGKFESATCDDRNMLELACFASLDHETESVRRYQPHPQVLKNAVANQDFSKVMHANQGTLTYLLLIPNTKTFMWTNNKELADEKAAELLPNIEGIDHYEGKLYFVSKMLRQLYILDLDDGTYEVFSTVSGPFKGQPDQIKHLIHDDPTGSAHLYFLEDGGKTPGVFARNLKSNQAYSILEKMEDEFFGDEATGLAFCDNFRRLLFAFQERGVIYEVTRDDGLPFYGATLNVKYHDPGSGKKEDDRTSFDGRYNS